MRERRNCIPSSSTRGPRKWCWLPWLLLVCLLALPSWQPGSIRSSTGVAAATSVSPASAPSSQCTAAGRFQRCLNVKDHATFRETLLSSSCQSTTCSYESSSSSKNKKHNDDDKNNSGSNDKVVAPFQVVALLTTDQVFDKGVSLVASLLTQQVSVTVLAWETWMPDAQTLREYILGQVPCDPHIPPSSPIHPASLLQVHMLPLAMSDQPCWIREDRLDIGHVAPTEYLECAIRNAPGVLRVLQPFVDSWHTRTILIDDGRTLPGLLLAERLHIPLISLLDDVDYARLILGPPDVQEQSWTWWQRCRQLFKDRLYSVQVSRFLLRSYNDLRNELGLPPVLKLSQLYQNVGSAVILSSLPQLKAWQSPTYPQVLVYPGPLIPPCAPCTPQTTPAELGPEQIVFHFPTTMLTPINRPHVRLAMQGIAVATRILKDWQYLYPCPKEVKNVPKPPHAKFPVCLPPDVKASFIRSSISPVASSILSSLQSTNSTYVPDLWLTVSDDLTVTRIGPHWPSMLWPTYITHEVQHVYDAITPNSRWIVSLCSLLSSTTPPALWKSQRSRLPSAKTNNSHYRATQPWFPHEELAWWWPEYVGMELICVDPERSHTPEQVAATILDHMIVPHTPDLSFSMSTTVEELPTIQQARAAQLVISLVFDLYESSQRRSNVSTVSPVSMAHHLRWETLQGLPSHWTNPWFVSDAKNKDDYDHYSRKGETGRCTIPRWLLCLAIAILFVSFVTGYQLWTGKSLHNQHHHNQPFNDVSHHSESSVHGGKWWYHCWTSGRKAYSDEWSQWMLVLQQWWNRQGQSSTSPLPSTGKGLSSSSRHSKKQQQQQLQHHHHNGHAKAVKKKQH
jgi:hypothetical protein